MSESSRSQSISAYLKKLFSPHSSEDVRETIEDLIEENATNANGFSPREQELLNNLLYLKDKKVCRVMTPRSEIIAFRQSGSAGELARLMVDSGHSRIPVYGESLDDIVGVLHIIDVAKNLLDGKAEKPISEIVTSNVKIVSPDSMVPDLLQEMQQGKNHMAMVMDDYGGLCGLITIEDLLEEIVGDIKDEYDPTETPAIALQKNDFYIADAKATIEDVETVTGIRVFNNDCEEEECSVDTIGGYLFQLQQRIPNRGEIITGPNGLRFKILEVEPNRIKKIMIITNPQISAE